MSAQELEFTIPVSVQEVDESLADWPFRKPIAPDEGKCVECGWLTENQDDGDWICEGCLADAIAETKRNQMLDDPRHNQAAELNWKYRGR